MVADIARKKEAVLHVLGLREGPHLHPGDIIIMNDHDELFHSVCKNHIDKADFLSLLEELMPVLEKGVCERGNAACSAGIADQNIMASRNDEVMKPQAMIKMMAADVCHMCIMTDLVYDFFDYLHRRDSCFELPSIIEDNW